ncbi:MAG: archease [Syntrophotaleaceae bacterium]
MAESHQPPHAAGTYRLLEHTADMGIEAQAATLDALFVGAARGLLEVLFGQPCLAGEGQRLEVKLEAGDTEELLVAWLGEILFQVEQRRFCPAVFQFDEIGRRHLRGSITGEYQRKELVPLREVKAVTYHRLKVEQRQDGWKARVYLDL